MNNELESAINALGISARHKAALAKAFETKNENISVQHNDDCNDVNHETATRIKPGLVKSINNITNIDIKTVNVIVLANKLNTLFNELRAAGIMEK